jgi:hypothetical protein
MQAERLIVTGLYVGNANGVLSAKAQITAIARVVRIVRAGASLAETSFEDRPAVVYAVKRIDAVAEVYRWIVSGLWIAKHVTFCEQIFITWVAHAVMVSADCAVECGSCELTR